MTTSPDGGGGSLTPRPAPLAWAPFAIGPLIVVIAVVALCGPFAIDVMSGLALDGAILVAYLVSAFGWGSWLARRAPVPLRLVTSTAIGLGLMGLIELALGLAGALSISSLIVLLAIGLGAAVWHAKPWKVGDSRRGTPGGHERWWLVPFAAILGLAIIAASMCPGFLWKQPGDPHPYDAVSYHLQVPREWYDAGRILPLQHNTFSYFPMAMEAHYLAAMHLRGGAWAGVYLCQFLTLAHGALAVAAVGQASRALGASSLRAWSAAMIVATTPWVFQLSTVAYVEAGVMLYTTLAVGWAMLALREPSKWAFAIVGLCAGLACGMKYTAFVMTAGVVIGLLVVFEVVHKRFAPAAIAVLVTMATASPWLVRNVVWTGNPVFPLATSAFGKSHFSDDQVDRYVVAHRPPEGEQGVGARIENGWHRTFADPQFGFVVLPAGVLMIIAGMWLARDARRQNAFLAIGILAMVLIWLAATHVVPRFVTPIVPLAALAIALVPIDGRAALVIAIAQGVTGLSLLWGWLSPTLDVGRQGLLRLSDPTVLESDEVRAARLSGAPIALIGDAQAFFYDVPSDRLIYRSVFDVRVSEGATLIDGWLGEPVESLRARGAWVIINFPELQRLSATYRHLPAVPAIGGPPVIVLPPTGK